MGKMHKKDLGAMASKITSNKGKKQPHYKPPKKGPTDFDAIADHIIEIHKETIKELEKY